MDPLGRPAAIGVDVGGTKIASGIVDTDGQVLTIDRVPTPGSPEPLLAAMVDAGVRLRQEVGVDLPIGVGFPGLITRQGVARYGPNISLVEFPLREYLREAWGGRVVLDNDATAATWAEFCVGSGRDVATDMLMFTLGTGVGGGIVADGRILHGHNGFAGEVGHLIVDIDGEAGASGVPGELEAYSSGNAMGRLGAEAARRGEFDGTPLEGIVAPEGAAITAAALDGLEPAIAVLRAVGHYLGVAAAGLANCLDPELIVVGGGAAAAGELILQPARQALARHLLGVEHRPHLPIVAASLGSEAGLIGAALLGLEG